MLPGRLHSERAVSKGSLRAASPPPPGPPSLRARATPPPGAPQLACHGHAAPGCPQPARRGHADPRVSPACGRRCWGPRIPPDPLTQPPGAGDASWAWPHRSGTHAVAGNRPSRLFQTRLAGRRLARRLVCAPPRSLKISPTSSRTGNPTSAPRLRFSTLAKNQNITGAK